MYATCLFCNRQLGSNESIEHFPVGRRLAFDSAKGRLWVVCPACERWNLTPLEERWEAIEDAERLYRGTRLRAATDQIGLARLRDGTELVRIGEPLRPEFAAWRYGDQFGRRRRRQMLIAGAGVGAIGAIVAGGLAAGASIGGFGWLIANLTRATLKGNPRSVVARMPCSCPYMVRYCSTMALCAPCGQSGASEGSRANSSNSRACEQMPTVCPRTADSTRIA